MGNRRVGASVHTETPSWRGGSYTAVEWLTAEVGEMSSRGRGIVDAGGWCPRRNSCFCFFHGAGVINWDVQRFVLEQIIEV